MAYASSLPAPAPSHTNRGFVFLGGDTPACMSMLCPQSHKGPSLEYHLSLGVCEWAAWSTLEKMEPEKDDCGHPVKG